MYASRFVRPTAILLASVVLLAGGSRPEASSGTGPRGDAARIDATLVADLGADEARAVGQAVNEFGFDLFAEVADGKQNTVTSPLSVAVLLSMVLAGADGDTAAEMAKVLRLADRRDVRVGALLRALAGTDQVTLSIANALWAGQGKPFEEDYLSFVRRAFGATVDEADLGSPDTAKAIDAWVDKNTNGLIRQIAADLGLPDPNMALVLVNAVYFLGRWTTTFNPAHTRPEPFTLADGATVDVPMMQLKDATFGYTQRDGFRMVRLPYGKDGRYGMEVLLPDDGTTLPELLGSLDASQWRAAVASLDDLKFDELALPRFEAQWKLELNGPLQRLGMRTAFDPGKADFRSMSPLGLWLETVVHKTYIKVDEHGTKAAAVTGGAMATAAMAPTVFRVDRPFAFTISDRQTGTILFLGAITDPRA